MIDERHLISEVVVEYVFAWDEKNRDDVTRHERKLQLIVYPHREPDDANKWGANVLGAVVNHCSTCREADARDKFNTAYGTLLATERRSHAEGLYAEGRFTIGSFDFT